MPTKITPAAEAATVSPNGSNDVYKWLANMPPGLLLDVGAAAGWMTKMMLKESPSSRVVAFEPFPGNHRFLDAFSEDARVRVVKKAVSNYRGTTKFFVAQTVKDGAGAWANMDGYSSVGMIVPEDDPKARRALTVETCRLDDEVSEPVRFMKIDVQGAEPEVLDGARALFDKHGVELALIEFMGDVRVVKFLAERGYAIMDTNYSCTPLAEKLDPRDWKILASTTLSTGHTNQIAAPLQAPSGPEAYCEWFAEQLKRYRAIWTDLVAIAPWSTLLHSHAKLSP
jgi:FkbM family methyltransferase